MKRSNEGVQDNKSLKRPRLQREIQWKEEQFKEITTHGIKIMPKNIAKYLGSVTYDKRTKKWHLNIDQYGPNEHRSSHKTQQEAEQLKIEIATRKNLVKNVIYLYKNEYYCVLTRNQLMKFSLGDMPIVEKYMWSVMLSLNSMSFYAVSTIRMDDGRRVSMKFHSLLFPNIEKGMTVDHINPAETLDNTRSNLRPATQTMQCVNQRLRLDNKSGIKGVCYISSLNGWCAYWTNDKGHVRSKSFSISKHGETAKEKAIAYRKHKESIIARYNCIKNTQQLR